MSACAVCGGADHRGQPCPRAESIIATEVRAAIERQRDERDRKMAQLARDGAQIKSFVVGNDRARLALALDYNRGTGIILNEDTAAAVMLATDEQSAGERDESSTLAPGRALVTTSPAAVYVLGTSAAGQRVSVIELPPGRQDAEMAQLVAGLIAGTTELVGAVRIQDGNGETLADVATGAADALAAATNGIVTFLRAFNGATWDRLRSASAAVIGAFSSLGAVLSASPGEWAIENRPIAATQATITRAAVAGTVHVARSITACLTSAAGLVAAQELQVVLRDGLTGAGAVLWSARLSIPNVVGERDKIVAPLNIAGTAGNAMTLEFTAAGGAGTFESVSLSGYDAPA